MNKAEAKLGVSLDRLKCAKDALGARATPFVDDFLKNVDI